MSPDELWAKLEIVYLKSPPILEGDVPQEIVHMVTIANVPAILIDRVDSIFATFLKDGVWHGVSGYLRSGNQA